MRMIIFKEEKKIRTVNIDHVTDEELRETIEEEVFMGHRIELEPTSGNNDKHRVDCSWCKKIIVPGPPEPISHGICESCRDWVIAELRLE